MPVANDTHCPQHYPVEGNFTRPEKELLQPQSALPLSVLDPSFQGISPPHPSVRLRGTSAAKRGWTGPIRWTGPCPPHRPSSTGLERASNIHGSDWHAWTCPISTFFQGYCFTGGGSSLGHVPTSCRDLGKAFQLLAVTAPQQDSAHGWTGASLQAGGLSASPAAAATCCHVLIGTAENLAPHLRHVLISLWINNYRKKGLFKICFESVFQILPFSNSKHC